MNDERLGLTRPFAGLARTSKSNLPCNLQSRGAGTQVKSRPDWHGRGAGATKRRVSTCACFVVLLVIISLRLIGIEKYDVITAGALMLGLSAPMFIVPLIATILARQISPGILSAAGLMIAAAGLVGLPTSPETMCPCLSCR